MKKPPPEKPLPKNAVPWFITILAVAAVVLGWIMFVPQEKERARAVQQVKNSTSDIKLRMTVKYQSGKIDSEEYRMQDLNGRSHAVYQITASSGKTYTITSPTTATYTVPFFFEKLVADGVWKIVNQPPRGNTNAQYVVQIQQAVQGEHGQRTIVFYDPHWLATTAGRQFHIHLDKNKPVPDLLKMSSTALADPRYEQIVGDFRAFGTPGFRKKVAGVQNRVKAGL